MSENKKEKDVEEKVKEAVKEAIQQGEKGIDPFLDNGFYLYTSKWKWLLAALLVWKPIVGVFSILFGIAVWYYDRATTGEVRYRRVMGWTFLWLVMAFVIRLALVLLFVLAAGIFPDTFHLL
ncbi:hypothetical protein ACFYKX_11740 [Cytobacillus sp. FJAT-54145]|uniref:Uncharacterized protein n=1 Tax=Cytobacillus spartinae TaxID=3299023 RepID=A0ABW6KB20_9BACI